MLNNLLDTLDEQLISLDSAVLNKGKLGVDAGDLNMLSDLLERIVEWCHQAYQKQNHQSLFIIQKLLFNSYKLFSTIPKPSEKTIESSWGIALVRQVIEEYFLTAEESYIPVEIWEQIPQKAEKYVDWLIEMIQAHPAYYHPFYEKYLSKYASLDDLCQFLIQESTIDTRFDDFLAMLQIGTDGGIKMEIASNYWDEMGNGSPSKMHVTMFARTMVNLGIDPKVCEELLTTEALVCGNLSTMVCYQRKHFYKGIGYFAATEYMTPRRFKHILTALKRNGRHLADAEYHQEHIAIDAIHAQNWFKNVIVPLVDKEPETVFEMTRGALYRLNTSKRYLDMLLSKTR